MWNEVLSEMEISSNTILMIGLVFEMIISLFVVLSILLVYSLLKLSVEQKMFDSGVMRALGL